MLTLFVGAGRGEVMGGGLRGAQAWWRVDEEEFRLLPIEELVQTNLPATLAAEANLAAGGGTARAGIAFLS